MTILSLSSEVGIVFLFFFNVGARSELGSSCFQDEHFTDQAISSLMLSKLETLESELTPKAHKWWLIHPCMAAAWLVRYIRT